MRFHHTIEACNDAEDPMWDVVIAGDELEECDGTSRAYGREVLQNWVDDQNSLYEEPCRLTDEYGNPYMRVVVRLSDNPGDDQIAVVGSDELDDQTSSELDLVDAARDAKLYARHLDRLADDQLEEALTAASGVGHGANDLARRVAPAVSRPIALRMMRA